MATDEASVYEIKNQMTPEENQALGQTLKDSGMFKPKTSYLLIGDEPAGGAGVLDLKSFLPSADVESLKQFLTFMPRSIFREWFMTKVWPNLPQNYVWDYRTNTGLSEDYEVYGNDRRFKKQFEDLLWASFIDLFNEANLSYVNQNQIEPWTWEQQKLEAYYVSQSNEAINAVESEFNSFLDVTLSLDPKAKEIMDAYESIPKLGDQGLEINRQNAVKELLKQKDYVLAQAIVDAYRYAQDTVLGPILTEPIPFDVTNEVGGAIVKKT